MILPAPTLPGQKTFLLISLFLLTVPAFTQKPDSTQSVLRFGAAASVMHNGISVIPTFSLGKPAAIFDLSLGKKRLSFEPQFRFALEGKPWSFLFWWRYKLVTTNKFRLHIGAHPALNFKTAAVTINEQPGEVITARRFLAGEIAPNYFITKNFSLGMYYLGSHGFEKEVTRATHFLTFNANFSHIQLPRHFFLRFNPQVFYLKMDDQDGFYVTSTLTIAKNNFPLSISAIANKVIRTNITASKDFVWNVALIYSFSKNFVAK